MVRVPITTTTYRSSNTCKKGKKTSIGAHIYMTESAWEIAMKEASDDRNETETTEFEEESTMIPSVKEDDTHDAFKTSDHGTNEKPVVIDLSLNEWRQRMVITKEQEQMLADVKLLNRLGLKDKFADFLEHQLKEKYGITKEKLQKELQKKKKEIERELRKRKEEIEEELQNKKEEFEETYQWTEQDEALLLKEQQKLIRDLIEKQELPDRNAATEAAKGAAVVAATKLFDTMMRDHHHQSLDNTQTRYADAFDEEGAEKYMREAAFLGWMLFGRRLSKYLRENSFFCCCTVTPLQIFATVYFLVAFYTFPVSWLIVDYFEEDDHTDVFRPRGTWWDTFQKWELTDILLFFVQTFLITGFTALVHFLAHISTLEINGSLYNKHIEVFRPYVDSDTESQRTSDSKTSDTENPEERDKISRRNMLRESFWIKQDTNGEIERLLNASRRRHRWFFFLGYIGIGLFFVVGGFTYSYSRVLIKMDKYFVLDLVLKILVSVIASLNGMAIVIIVADHTSLMTAHFNGFEENLNLLCLRALTSPKKDGGKIDKEEEILKGLMENLKEYEDYLMSVAAATRAVFEAGFNRIYFAIVCTFFFMLFYLYAAFLQIIQQGHFSGADKEFTALACLVGTVVMTFPAAYPLYRMTEQSQTWKEFTDRLGRSIYIDAERLLSDEKEIFDFQATFRKLQDHFTWKILGYPLSYTVITGSVISYLAVLWASIIYPAIQEYAGNQLDKLDESIQNPTDFLGDL